MTRRTLLKTLAQPRDRRNGGRRARKGARKKAFAVDSSPPAAASPALQAPSALAPEPRPTDPDLKRARDAGGPTDRACYTCGCGYVFDAAVSTTVSCPHCGLGQAW